MSQVFSAGVFVIDKDRKVLSVKEGCNYRFPQMKISKEELPPHTAIKACFQETGYVPFTYLPSAYAGLDKEERVIKIYRAIIVSKGLFVSDKNTEVVWSTLDSMISDLKYGDFNRAVFEHFGVI